MKQKPRHALLESLANTAAGFIVSNVAWPAIQIFILHQPWRFSQGLLVVGVFTALSIGRNYLLRRVFDHFHHRGHHEEETLSEYRNRQWDKIVQARKETIGDFDPDG